MRECTCYVHVCVSSIRYKCSVTRVGTAVVYTFVVCLCVYGNASVHTLCACTGLSALNSTGRGSAQLRPGRRASGDQQDKGETTMKVGWVSLGLGKRQ